MKAPSFEYERPTTLAAALSCLARPDKDAFLLAGGQSLMPMMNFRLAQPDILVDINNIGELKGIIEEDNALVIGAMTRYAELERSPVVAKRLPLIKQALPHIAHPAIRNRGTIGGSIALADPAAEMPALLLALDATILAVSSEGERRIPADQFFTGLYQTALEKSEIVKALSIPTAGPDAHFAFEELARRHGDYAMIGVAIAAASIMPYSDLRIAFFSIGDRAIRATGAEEALAGRTNSDELAIANALDAVRSMEFEGDLNASSETKRHLAQVLLKRALAKM